MTEESGGFELNGATLPMVDPWVSMMVIHDLDVGVHPLYNWYIYIYIYIWYIYI